MLDLSAVATFIEIVKRGTFLGASAAQNVLPSTVSKKIARLEADLGARLINRSTHDLSLTEAGIHFLEYAKRIQQEVLEARETISEITEETSGRINIHLTPAAGLKAVAPILIEFMEAHPRISINVSVTARIVDMLGEKIDLSIRRTISTDNNMPSTSIDGLKLTSAEYCIVASKKYFDEHGIPNSPKDLVSHNCLIYSRDGAAHRWEFLAADGTTFYVPIRGSLVSDEMGILKDAASAGLGIARIHASDLNDRSDLIRIFDHQIASNRSLWAFFPRTRHRPKKLTDLLDLLVRRFH